MASSSTIRKTPGNKASKTAGKPPAETVVKATAKAAAPAAAKTSTKAAGKARAKNPGQTSKNDLENISEKIAMHRSRLAAASAVGAVPAAATAAASAPAPADTHAESPAGGALKLRDLVDRIAGTTGQPRPQVKSAVEAALAILAEALDQGQPLNLPHLGKIRISKAGDPAEGQPMVLKLRRDLSSPKHG